MLFADLDEFLSYMDQIDSYIYQVDDKDIKKSLRELKRRFPHHQEKFKQYKGLSVRSKIFLTAIEEKRDFNWLKTELENNNEALPNGRSFFEMTVMFCLDRNEEPEENRRYGTEDFYRVYQNGIQYFTADSNEENLTVTADGEAVTARSLMNFLMNYYQRGNDISRQDDGESVHEEKKTVDMDTMYWTRHIAEDIRGVEDEDGFIEEVKTNKTLFDGVRRKTRFYFCKYLLYLILQRYLDFYKIFSVLKEARPTRYLHEHKSSVDAARELIEDHLYLRPLDDAEYGDEDIRSVDDFIASLRSDLFVRSRPILPPGERLSDGILPENRLSEVLRSCQSKISPEDLLYFPIHFKKLNEYLFPGDTRISDQHLVKLIKGEQDISRRTLIYFLSVAYFKLRKTSYSQIQRYFHLKNNVEDEILSEDRMNAILRDCGFAELNDEERFDDSVLSMVFLPDCTDDPDLFLGLLNDFDEAIKTYTTYTKIRLTPNPREGKKDTDTDMLHALRENRREA